MTSGDTVEDPLMSVHFYKEHEFFHFVLELSTVFIFVERDA